MSVEPSKSTSRRDPFPLRAPFQPAADAAARRRRAFVAMSELALALFGWALVAGAVTGAIAAWRRDGAPRLPAAAGIALALLAMFVSTRSGTLDVVPLTLLFGVVVGGLPFWAAYRLARRLVDRARPAARREP